MGLASSGSYMTKPNPDGVIKCRPIYDWTARDVWKAILDNGWDYNKAYDVMFRLGIPPNKQRIGPPTMTSAGIDLLNACYKAWPKWFDRVCDRLPGVRSAAKFGKVAIEPKRALGETWKEAYQRLCIDEAPEWIAERATIVREKVLRLASHKGYTDINESSYTSGLSRNISNWAQLTKHMYNGDPFSMKQKLIKHVEPEYFRKLSGVIGGTPTW
jgi:predicted phosphoadenosine phosphosulfate sulfurtransferase